MVTIIGQSHAKESKVRFRSSPNARYSLLQVCNIENLHQWCLLDIRLTKILSVNNSQKQSNSSPGISNFDRKYQKHPKIRKQFVKYTRKFKSMKSIPLRSALNLFQYHDFFLILNSYATNFTIILCFLNQKSTENSPRF